MPISRIIFRNPVPGTVMKKPLRCIDLDPETGDLNHLVGGACAARYRKEKIVGKRYHCLHGCEQGTFLYPRKLSKNGYFHFHQGIDLGRLDRSSPEAGGRTDARGLPILAVTGGKVLHTQVWDGKSNGYGTAVSIFNEARQKLYWYAHCDSLLVDEGQTVYERQVIATVGNSGNAGAPHLHFEVIACPLIDGKPRYREVKGGINWERELGLKREPRLDPLEELEKLGPWGIRNLYFITGKRLSEGLTQEFHDLVERGKGGFFPLGVNNFWHGGVHIPMPKGSTLHAPFAGQIVAVRLGATPQTTDAGFGSVNFILMRHELPEDVFAKMQEGPVVPGDEPKPAPTPENGQPKIGLRAATNPPDKVQAMKQRLHELGHYRPADATALSDGTVNEALIDALKAFQRTIPNPYKKKPELWPDGTAMIPGHTWDALFPAGSESAGDKGSPEPSPANEKPPDDRRVVYALLMHLDSWTLEDALKQDVPWVLNARLPQEAPEHDVNDTEEISGQHEDEEPSIETEETPPYDEEADRREAASHSIQETVAQGTSNTADIEWIEARLIRLGFLTGRTAPRGFVDTELHDAIVAFQKQHPFPTKPKWWDGIITPGKKTDEYLRKTAKELKQIQARTPASSRGGRTAAPKRSTSRSFQRSSCSWTGAPSTTKMTTCSWMRLVASSKV